MAVRMTTRKTALTRTIRGAVVVAALTAGTFAATTAGASAQPLSIPGIDFTIPALPTLPNQMMPANPMQTPDVIHSAPSVGDRALSAAESKIGSPYVWGATGPNSFDCSGLTQWAYAQAGVSIPRTTYDQEASGIAVSKADLRPGDLVLYYGGDHIGIYAGNGQVVHAPTSGQSVTRAPLDSMPFHMARRY
ncbi:C40 family peptidase [Rhodococcus sp. OK302]|uniref:C40 family peptidase n=1 Tax=Rhodococcus sp. OK302 TaxID=1882769 RepID=UPI000B9F0146|nr:C40 family peptidase [Rhodococcus sp. OK302]OYD70600.1 cell wall-associated NlpC family hydrolase [Rhodococcus sp. OK302]